MTAVEWLFEQIPFEWSSSRAAFEAFEQAKAMEKEQIVKAYLEGDRNGFTRYRSVDVEQRISEQYYNETYNK